MKLNFLFGNFETTLELNALQKAHINGLISDLAFLRCLIMYSEDFKLSEELQTNIRNYLANHPNQTENALERFRQNINKPSTDGNTWLNIAIALQQLDIIPTLLENRANPNGSHKDEVDINYLPPLHQAAIVGNIPLLNTLLEKNANINLRTRQGYTALQLALNHQKPEAAHFLVSKEATFGDEEMRQVDEYLEANPEDEEYKALKKALEWKNSMKCFGIKVCCQSFSKEPTFNHSLLRLIETPTLPDIQRLLSENPANPSLTELLDSQGVFANRYQALSNEQRQLLLESTHSTDAEDPKLLKQ